MLKFLFNNKISASNVKSQLEKGNVILLDVRTPKEYEYKRINGSVSLPLDTLVKEIGKVVPDKESEIIVYCQSGARAQTAITMLKGLGYSNVKSLGGIINWPYETISGR